MPHMCLMYETRLGCASLHASDETLGTTGNTRIIAELRKKLSSRFAVSAGTVADGAIWGIYIFLFFIKIKRGK